MVWYINESEAKPGRSRGFSASSRQSERPIWSCPVWWREGGPGKRMNVAEIFWQSALYRPHSPALALGERHLCSYAAFARRAAALSAALRGRFALPPGERVALAMKNVPDYLLALAAVWHAGLVAVPMNAKLHPREFAFMLEHSGARLCLATRQLAEALSPELEGQPQVTLLDVEGTDWRRLCAGEDSAAPLPRGADDLAWLFYTSGTTGRPKGAMLTHGNLRAMTACYFADIDAIGPQDAILHAAPLSHGSGLYALPHWHAGALQLLPESGGFEPEEVRALAQVHRGIGAFFAPTMVKRLVEAADAGDWRLPGIKTLVYGGGPMYVADIRRALTVLGPVFVQVYGQGESPMCIASLPRDAHARDGDERRLGSVGRAQSLCDVRVVDERGEPLPAGGIGEILVRGPSVMAGYWRDPDATARTLAGGFLHTGDVGQLDGEGFLTLIDRSKDVIISGGSNIYPREVEEVLLTHPAVLECSVVGERDADWGEIVVAFVVPRPGCAPPGEAALDAHCLANLARFKRPKRYRLLESLPKNNYGKVLKTELRRLLAE